MLLFKLQEDLWCFVELLIGSAHAALFNNLYAAEHSFPLLWEYRTRLLTYHKVDPFPIITQHKLIVVKKNGKRKFHNLDEIFPQIVEHYSHLSPEIWIDQEEKDFTRQLKKITQATIVISPCGGISVPFFFLTAGSALIVTEEVLFRKKYLKNETEEQFELFVRHMEGHLWDYVTHIKTQYYGGHPGNFKDYKDSRWREDIFLPADKQIKDIRDFGEFILYPELLFPMIDQAVYHISQHYR